MLAVASVAGFAGALDLSMLFVAYPAIADAFPDTSPALLSWVVTVYSIVLAALLIPSGRLADRLGRRRVFLTGIAVFGVGASPRDWPPARCGSSRRGPGRPSAAR